MDFNLNILFHKAMYQMETMEDQMVVMEDQMVVMEDREMTMIGQVISIDRIKEGQMILSSR